MDTTLADPLLGRVLDGRYRIQERIARGGMATVYRAIDLRLDRPVAVKVMHSSLAEDPEFVSRFTREAKSAARLSHPNVVAVFDQGSDGGVVFLVMEYVDGATLRDLIRERGRLSPRQSLDVVAPILAALDAAHSAGIVHRDIKPENVLIASDGRIKVADFGLARAIQASQLTATTGLLIGTAAYLAPEQIEHGVADPRTDLYAAGIVLYELLTGKPPYDGATPMAVVFKHVHEQVPAPSLVRPEVPRQIDALVLDATQRDPEDRPPTAAELLEQLQAAARTLPAEPLDLTMPTQVLGEHLTTVIRTGPAQTLVAPPEEPPAPPSATKVIAQPPRPSWVRGWRLAVLLLVLVTLIAAGVGAYIGIRTADDSTDKAGAAATTASTTASTTSTGTAPTSAAAASQVTVPDFTDKTETEAGALAGTDLTPTYVPGGNSAVPAGQVMSQDLQPNTSVDAGSPITLTLSAGPAPVPIPTTLVGMTSAEAANALQTVGLTLGSHSSEYSDTIAENAIIRVTTTGPVAPGSPVAVVLSRGPTPVAVPDEHGKDAGTAAKDLAAQGFTNVKQTQDYSDTVAQGNVISQTPTLPASLQPAAAITLDVSKGPQLFAIPPLKGLSATDAEARLVALGMKYHTIRLPNGPGTVVYTTPSAGRLEPRGTIVTLEIF